MYTYIYYMYICIYDICVYINNLSNPTPLLVTYTTYTDIKHFIAFKTQISTYCYLGNSSI